jgi:UDP:flavonoid glycosyltransferase YjiC (YdhE family)
VRILVVSTPGLGHVNPRLPLALAARDAGHSVEWATAADAVPTVERFGFPTHVVGMTLDERGRRLRESAAGGASLPPRERRPGGFRTRFAVLAGPVAAADLGPVLDAEPPDLVVHETAELGSAPVATARGIPHVTVGFGAAIPAPVLAAAADAVAPMWTALGRDRPLVYATFGTEFAVTAPWSPVLEALEGLDIDAVCTASRAIDPARPGSGAGLAIDADQVTPQTVHDALRRLLHEDGFAAAARGIADEIRAMPSPADRVPDLERLIAAAPG